MRLIVAQFSSFKYNKINVVLVLDISRPQSKICSLRTVLPMEKMHLQ